MMIDKIGGVNPGYGPRKPEPSTRPDASRQTSDNVTISQEASRAAELARIARTAGESRDESRVQKLKEIKEKLERGDYNELSDEVLSHVADNITASFMSES